MSKKKPSPWTAGDFYKLKWVDEVVLSPDGKKAAFTVREVDRDENRYASSVWIANVPKGRPRRLTWGGGRGDRQPVWSPDGKRLAFTSARSGTDQIHEIALAGGEARPVTDMARGAHSPVYAPDGKRIAFLSKVNEAERLEATRKGKRPGKKERERLEAERREAEARAKDPRVIRRLLYRTGQVWRDGRWTHVFVQDLGKKSPPLSLTEGDFDHGRPKFHPNGAFVFTLSEQTGTEGHEEVYDLLRIPASGGEPEFITRKICVTSFDLSPDGRFLAYTSVPSTKYFKHPVVAKVRDLSDGTEKEVSKALDADTEDVSFSSDGKTIYFRAPYQGNVWVFAVPPDRPLALQPAVEGDRTVLAYDVSPQAETIALVVSAPDIPADLFFQTAAGETRRVTSLCKDLVSRRSTIRPEEMRFPGHGGLEIQGWVMHPPGRREGEPGKLAVEVHGGPHIMWGNSFWHEFQVLASAGYTVFFCNPRGSNGYGLMFKSMLYRHWGEDDSKDVLAGVDKLVKAKVADPKQLYLAGGSYGGFLTAWIVTHDKRFRAAVAQRGVYNLVSMYNGSDAQCLLDWEFDTAPWDDPMLLLKHSPVHFADRVETPTMIMHAECDYTATIPSAEEFYNALKRNGVDTVFVRYPREGHELSRSGEPAHRVDRIERIAGWFDAHEGA